jgi:hypothetical protein
MPICEGCGASYEDTYKFCPHCGRAKPEPLKVNIEVDVSHKTSPYDCPLCGDSGSVQKVSAIVASGTSEASENSKISGISKSYSSISGKQIGDSYLSGTANTNAVQQSKLAQLLALPDPPKKTPSTAWVPGCVTYGVVFFAVLTVMVQISESSNMGLGGEIFVNLFLGGIVTGIAVWGIQTLVNNLRGVSEEDRKAEEKYQSQMKIYNSAKMTWGNLYYCHRHDIIFLEENKDYAPKDEAWQACVRWSSKK